MLRRTRVEDLRAYLGVEWIMALIIIASVIYTACFLYINSYLPQPFFFEPNDLYADWFNTAYWARDTGTYDVWTTLYPPLSFVFLRLVTLDSCYLEGRAFDPSVGYSARECDWLGLGSIWGLWLLDIVLVYLTFRKVDRATAIPRTICIGLGWPILDGVERGNLVLVSFACVILGFGPLLRSARAKWLFAGLAVNFKVYLIAGVAAQLLRRRWRWVECAVLSTALVYLVTYTILGRGTPYEIYRNLKAWSEIEMSGPLDLWFSTSYTYLITLLKSDDPTMGLLLGSQSRELIILGVTLLVRSVQALILAAAAAVWLRPESVPLSRVINLGFMLALITTEAGGYSPNYFMFFVLMEPWRGPGRKVAIFLCYALAVNADIGFGQLPPIQRDTYFRNLSTVVTFQVTVMPFVRPLLILIVATCVASITIREVWVDIRLQGWSARKRFRRDLPFLPGVQRPTGSPKHQGAT